ncbi:MAG: class I SAM-dependent methyltransferase [Caldimicrobium sp.]|nr:class I SAM-dependent methyltransferase [Caldimicrobium sp.]
MRGKFPFYIGSEYGKHPEALFPIIIEDLQNLSFRDQSFDCIIVNDVFEHLPDLDKALSEILRCLKKGGYLLSTFPFLYMSEDSKIKARLKPTGEVEYLEVPEYHGNPVDPSKGSLVFQILGWDILKKLTLTGFKLAEMIFILSEKYGILCPNISGCFVCVAQK